MAENLIISKPGKTKEQLLGNLENFKSEFSKFIAENNVKIRDITDGFNVRGEKKFLFMSFWIDANIIAGEGVYKLGWETNAPKNKVDEAMAKVKEVLEKS
jgi:hypothetical protein